jgi:hypothetical protein
MLPGEPPFDLKTDNHVDRCIHGSRRPDNPKVYAIDWGVEGGDKTVEVEMEKLPDGTGLVKSFGEVIEGTWREIEN